MMMNRNSLKWTGMLSLGLLVAGCALMPEGRNLRNEAACQENLIKLDGSKEQWGLENAKKPGDQPTRGDLTIYLRVYPVCPSGGGYVIGPLESAPICKSGLPGHTLEAAVEALRAKRSEKTKHQAGE